MNFKIGFLIICSIYSFRIGIYAQIYANSLDKIPTDWGTKPKFTLSKDYPKTLEIIKDNYPWKGIDFKTEPERYLRSVLEYFYEGNIEVDFVVEKNIRRKWYHAPSLAWQPEKRPYGREFIHGLTKELTSVPKQLHPSQDSSVQNWAIGFYNAIGAYTVGKVWKDTNKPLKNIKFENNTVSAKLLFTAATEKKVPYIKGAKIWQANIHLDSGKVTRTIQNVRLLQVDLAIKDYRSPVGWVFGTFIYDQDSEKNNPWRKLLWIGTAWGNSDCTQKINKNYQNKFPFLKLGQGDMTNSKNVLLNGPVDNPKSSCISCHSKAGGDSTIVGCLDYALQLEKGIKGFKINNHQLEPFFREKKENKGYDFSSTLTTEERSIDEIIIKNTQKPKRKDTPLAYWTLCVVIFLTLLLILFFIFKK